MIFTLAYVPFVLIVYHYYGVSIAGLALAGAGTLLGTFSWYKHHIFKKLLSPVIAAILGIGAYFSGSFIALKLYPLLLSLLFLLYFIASVITKRYPIIGWVEKFKKRPLNEQELQDVIVSHRFWIGVLAVNSIIHLFLVFNSDTTLWAFYSFAGWYLYFGVAMALQLMFAHRAWVFQWGRNIWGYGLFGGVIAMGFIPAMVSYLFQRVRKNPKAHVVFQSITAAMFRLFFRYAPNCSNVIVIKDEALLGDKHYIYAASHESWLDYPLMGAYITDLYHLTNKKNAFFWSIRGIAKLLGVIDGVGNHALHALLQKLRENSNVLIFPEGSRESDNSLLPFKRGAFSLSIESGVSIVPVILSGTRRLVPKGTIHWQNVRNITIRIQMLEPITPCDGESAEELMQRVWSVMNDAKQ
jgi:1-acyl-sn-glycerol-3-phosphate acyltransferase